MSLVNIYDISWFFLFLRRYVVQTRKKRFLSICKKIRNKNVLICILIYRHSKRSCYTNRVMMTTWPGHLIKRLFTIKNTVKKIYICQNNLIASVVVETGGCCMVWNRLPYIYIYWLPIPISYQKNSSPTCTSQQILSKFTPAIIYKLL